jgi:hypothetical protein
MFALPVLLALASSAFQADPQQPPPATPPVVVVQPVPVEPVPAPQPTVAIRPVTVRSGPRGVIPGVLIGPRIGIISAPAPGVGLELKFGDYLGASFDFQFVPSITIQDVTFRGRNWDLGVKAYPFAGSFFVGAIGGAFRFFGRDTITAVDGSTARADVDVAIDFLGPQVGWTWISDSGFFAMLDAGWEFPLSYRSTLTVPPGAPAGTVATIHDDFDRYAKHGVPTVALLQLGWFF